MKKIPVSDYHLYMEWAKKNTANRVFPCSITGGFQAGEICVDEDPAVEGDGASEMKAVFFWHECGFGYISGNASEGFLNDIYGKMTSGGRRLILITRDDGIVAFFRDKEDIQLDTRLEYAYQPEETDTVCAADPEFIIRQISADNISGIRGRIVPSFSWESADRFLQNGFGYLAFDGDRICAVAFSAAVSADEVDIGIETHEDYRRKGLAVMLAEKMCEHIVRIGKRPVWAHAGANTGSMKTALKCGFIRTGTDTVIRVKKPD